MYEHRADVEADLRILAGVPDWRTLDSRTFVELIERLPAYDGMVAARIRIEQAEEDERLKRFAADRQGAQLLGGLEEAGWLERA